MILLNALSDNGLNGVEIGSSKSNTVSENLVKDNREWGISLRDNSIENLITLNEISGYKRYCLLFDDSSMNFVQGNRIRNNLDDIITRYSSEDFDYTRISALCTGHDGRIHGARCKQMGGRY